MLKAPVTSQGVFAAALPRVGLLWVPVMGTPADDLRGQAFRASGREVHTVLTSFSGWKEKIKPCFGGSFSLKRALLRDEKGLESLSPVFSVSPFPHLGLETVES